MMITNRCQIRFFCLTIFSLLFGEIRPPANIHVIYSERSLDITWDSVKGAVGYNIYSSSYPKTPKQKKRKINKTIITSGTHFTFLWHFENGVKVRKIKGYRHYLAVTSVFKTDGKAKESSLSEEINNFYFDGFCNMNTRQRIQKIFLDSQKVDLLPVERKVNSKKSFLEFMDGTGVKFHALIKKNIDPLETGGCAPVSTVLVKLLKDSGLYAYRVEGNFINEFHTFAVINIEGVEYILDFTADQFVPDVTPVIVPRDFCYLNEKGKIAKQGLPIYTIAKIFNPDQISLSDNKTADVYRNIYNQSK